MFHKINIYYKGVYICSTNWSKTCKEAKERFIGSSYCNGILGYNINHDDIKTRFAGK